MPLTKSFTAATKVTWRNFADDEPGEDRGVCLYVPGLPSVGAWGTSGMAFGYFVGYGCLDECGDPVDVDDEDARAIFQVASFDEDTYPPCIEVEQDDFDGVWWAYADEVFPFTKRSTQ